ncbi:oxidoreductase [Paenibacillus sp. BR2-3]|uniref:oxidoreductase n=1 Tax=Paenibacillus sp. BR2-3 TaxID=3048494 RepID=UPI0039775399
MARIAMVLGATGLVGKAVTEALLGSGGWDEVRVLLRRPLDQKHPKLKQTLMNWEQLEQYEDRFSGVTAVFCCLGTTIRTAGSQSNFERVDLHYPLQAAAIAKKKGVKQFLAVSSMGANPKSRNFYSRTKGRTEEGLVAVNFQGLHLFRPSLLLGPRTEYRLGERVAGRLMKALDFLMVGKGAKYRAIQGTTVARAMIKIALAGTYGVHVYSNEVIHVLGKE